MTSTEIQLYLTVIEAHADAERLDELTGRLLRDLREFGAESVEQSSGGAVPEGAKGDSFTLGALALVAVPAFLLKLVKFLQAWSLRGQSSKVKIKTPTELEVEPAPEKKLSQAESVELVENLIQTQM